MAFIDIFALIVLIVIILSVMAVFVWAAMLPGKTAKARNHPQAEAINVAGWMGAIFGIVLWPLALVWAFTKPVGENVKTAKPRKGDAS